MSSNGPELISPQKLRSILDSDSAGDLLILDLRNSGQYAKNRIRGALNLCVPSTLIKRPAYGLQKLADSLTSGQQDRDKFKSWRSVSKIIVYDAASWTLAQAASCVQVINKFVGEKFKGTAYILKGGLNAYIHDYPDGLDARSLDEIQGAQKSEGLAANPFASFSVVGGVALPVENKMKPFFNNIRQNMDLIGGVGQFPVRKPAALTTTQAQRMPAWLREAAASPDKGKAVADRFLNIEKAEQQRMQKALSMESWASRGPASPNTPAIAGIEQGTKNRYKDILPFENTRVKLGEKNPGNCDYVNASHIRPHSTNMHYIACQAPVPTTFQDFWRVIWEQEARVIVMLTAETEEGNLKAHPYWKTGEYGNFKIELGNEHDEELHYQPDFRAQRIMSSPLSKPFSKVQQPPLSRRHTSTPSTTSIDLSTPPKSGSTTTQNHPEAPHVTVRHLTIANEHDPSQPPRPISQIQLASWPDTGSTARPKDVLALVDLCDSLDVKTATHPTSNDLKRKGKRPLIVHCSAGCGRTGTFCTVANVKRMLLKQLARRHQAPSLSSSSSSSNRNDDAMEVDGDEWITDENTDLIALTVAEFRLSRMSMVQTLRQYVLCYEAIMELFVHDDWYVGGLEDVRREETIERERSDRLGEERKSKHVVATTTQPRPLLGKRALTSGSITGGR